MMPDDNDSIIASLKSQNNNSYQDQMSSFYNLFPQILHKPSMPLMQKLDPDIMSPIEDRRNEPQGATHTIIRKIFSGPNGDKLSNDAGYGDIDTLGRIYDANQKFLNHEFIKKMTSIPVRKYNNLNEW